MMIPNSTYKINGVTVKEKIIPDGTRWKDGAKAALCRFKAGELYKAQRLLCENGRPSSVTIHNTSCVSSTADNGELYTAATYTENMGAARVHFYVDKNGAWQNLRAGTGMCPNDPPYSAEVGWHAGDTAVTDGGNSTSIGIEIIMGGTPEADKKAADNGARLAAWLLDRFGLTADKLVTHTYWVNHKAKRVFDNVDEQCTSPIAGLKWCPYYIFGSTSPKTALGNWLTFKNTVKDYVKSGLPQLKVGDKVKLDNEATVYNTTKRFASFVYRSPLYIRQINGSRAVISTLKTGAITGAVDIKYLQKV